MSSIAPPKHDWLVILPDFEGKLPDRMAVRPQHFAGVKKHAESGFFKVGGAILAEPEKEGEPLKITGSAVMAVAATREEVVAQLKEDIYFKSGVWDLDKAQIYPFKTAFRNP